MKSLVAAVAVSVALLAGTARADTISFSRAPLDLPTAETPNVPGSLVLPEPFETPPAVPQQRSYAELQALWQRAGAAYGIPWSVLAAINKIESNFGHNMGPSSANAIGWMQFLPSTWMRWGMDASGDGIADPWNPDDAVHAAARYLAAAGGRTDLPRAVFAYNHAQWYVDDVLGLAAQLGRVGTGAAFDLGVVGVGVDEAAEDVAEIERQLARLRGRARALKSVETRRHEQVEAATLLSDQLAARKLAVRVGSRHDAVAAQIRELERKLGSAEQVLETAQERDQASAFAPSLDALMAAPVAGDGYVFPVGGGPGLVSVGRDHHDYPAADIAAPSGAPVWALAPAIVEDAWHSPAGRCGIGLTMRTEDGLTWTYCHLAYLDPLIQPGSFLPAGAPVGLVGSTGHSTGPHLHLQLQPATAYPQDYAWFQSFAGSAFTWQGDGVGLAPASGRAHPVFSVVPDGTSAVVAFTR